MFRLHGVPQLRDATVRSRALGDGNISSWCVPGRQSVASFALHVSQKGPRTGKAPLHGNISPLCIQNELAMARYARHVCEKPCKSPLEDTSREYLARKTPLLLHGPFESRTARESCHSWVLRLGVADGVGEEWGEGGVPASARGFITPSALLPQLHRPARTVAQLEVVCRLPPKTWRCDGVSLNCHCSAVLF